MSGSQMLARTRSSAIDHSNCFSSHEKVLRKKKRSGGSVNFCQPQQECGAIVSADTAVLGLAQNRENRDVTPSNKAWKTESHRRGQQVEPARELLH